MNKTAFPLCWPDGWPRTLKANRKRSAFGKSGRYEGYDGNRRWSPGRAWSIEEARTFLAQELERMGVPDYNTILSTNLRLRADGNPASGQLQPDDVGVAVFFKLKKRAVALACDRWDRVQDNIYALAKHVEALRGQERWGVGNIEQAFRGYMALPASTGRDWWTVLGVAINASDEQVRAAYTALVKQHHPDVGGDAEKFREVQTAKDEFERLRRAAA